MIGALLGHSQYQTTLRYAHLADTQLRQAAEHISKAIAEKSKVREKWCRLEGDKEEKSHHFSLCFIYQQDYSSHGSITR